MATLDKIVLVLISNTGCPQHYKSPLSAIGIAVPKPEVSSKCLQIIAASPQNPKYSEDLQALDIKIWSYCIMPRHQTLNGVQSIFNLIFLSC